MAETILAPSPIPPNEIIEKALLLPERRHFLDSLL